ncbi:hypothetical protein J2S13_000350 [Oikeobacillus pervagus]|uniref:YbxH family protein n=1 Tax=Oikeobacillus pervagus TaxID=1325931 RepID=A0AAJ1SWD3_9BACI|nr:YbxH family protein [Oikeobacillus pervagus]MDQ0213955.1 hypothetical protein [Oikeobacillus pervagus]
MGAIERNRYRFVPEFSVIQQNGAIHVYKQGDFIEEIPFQFSGEYPEHDLIEELVNHYCKDRDI